jgi:hypothetical protein
MHGPAEPLYKRNLKYQQVTNFNGTFMFLHDRFLPNTTLDLYTNAAKSKGFGGVYGSRWFYGSFPDDYRCETALIHPRTCNRERKSANTFRFPAICFTLKRMLNCKHFNTKCLTMILASQSLLLCLLMTLTNASLSVKNKNVLADFLSRLQVRGCIKAVSHRFVSYELLPFVIVYVMRGGA